MSEYSVMSSDPVGYYLAPDGVLDPTRWAWMQHANPVQEIAALRAKVKRLEAVVEAARALWERTPWCVGIDPSTEGYGAGNALADALAALDAGGGE